MDIEALKVLIVEDNKAENEAFSLMLQHSPGFILVDSLFNANDIIDRIKETSPDVILMDIRLNDKENGGIEAIKIIKEKFPNLPVIMRTMFEDEEKIFKSLKAGAKGYLLKDMPFSKVIEALSEAKENGVSHISPKISLKILNFFEQKGNQIPGLSSRENDVLKLKIEGFSHKIIGDKLNIEKTTVDFHMKSIFKKLDVHSTPDLRRKLSDWL